MKLPAHGWATKGYDRLYGARPLSRIIQEHVKKPLAEELLFGKLVKGGLVQVDLKDDGLIFSYLDEDGDSTGDGAKKGKKKKPVLVN